jgi:hypothetical protein
VVNYVPGPASRSTSLAAAWLVRRLLGLALPPSSPNPAAGG